MKLLFDGEAALERTLTVREAREWALGKRALAGFEPLESGGLAVRFRFLHRLEVPPEGLAVRPPLPAEPTLLELLAVWATALEGVLWADGGQIAVFHVRREWANVAGVEVSL